MTLDAHRYGLIAIAAWLMLPGFAIAEDNQAGVPLSPAEAAGPWTLESDGTEVCTLSLSTTKSGTAGFTLTQGSCSGAIPADAAGWTPTGDGMAITARDGKVLVAFDRWSNSLFVSHRASGVDLQLKRGRAGSE